MVEALEGEIMDINVSSPAECPLRKYNNGHLDMKDKYYCIVFGIYLSTQHCPSSEEFPEACQLKDKSINIKRV
jgi:hypothetical protein